MLLSRIAESTVLPRNCANGDVRVAEHVDAADDERPA